MTNIDKSKAVRVLVIFLFGVAVIAFGGNLFGNTTESTSALLYPLTVFGVYIPLVLAVIGVLLGLAAYLLEGTLKKTTACQRLYFSNHSAFGLAEHFWGCRG